MKWTIRIWTRVLHSVKALASFTKETQEMLPHSLQLSAKTGRMVVAFTVISSHRNTQAFLSDCFAISTFPSVWDDPTKEQEVKQVCIDLGNAAFRGKFKEDAKTPLSGCLVTANFNLSEIEKYYSRVCLIPFKKLSKITHVGEGPALEKKATAASAALPTLLHFAHGIQREDVHDVVELLRTNSISDLRILEGVAVPCMLAKKILSACGLPHEELFNFCGRILNYHTTRGSPSDDSANVGESTPLQNIFLAAKDKEVSGYMRVTANKFYVRTREFDQSAGTDLAAVFKGRKIPLYGKSCRFDKQAKKCAMMTREEMSAAEWESLLELTGQPIQQPTTATAQPMPSTSEEMLEPTPQTSPMQRPSTLPSPKEATSPTHSQTTSSHPEIIGTVSPIQRPSTAHQQTTPIISVQSPYTSPAEVDTPIASSPFLTSIQLTKAPSSKHTSTSQLTRSTKRKIFSVTEKSAGPKSAEPKTKRKKDDVYFLGREILHRWDTDKGPKVYKGKVKAVVKGRDGERSTIYRVLYEDRTTEELDLYTDYADGSLKFA